MSYAKMVNINRSSQFSEHRIIQVLVALVCLIVCVTAHSEPEDEIAMFYFESGQSGPDLRANVESHVQMFRLRGALVTVYVGFENYSFAQNACSWAVEQRVHAFTSHSVSGGKSQSSCGIQLSISDVRSDRLGKHLDVLSELVESFSGTIGDWILIGVAD